MPPGSELWLNTERYTALQLLVFGAGCVLWIWAYVAVLQNVRRQQFVTIPAAAVVANVSWEFLWGFFFMPDMGKLIVWGYRAWAILDVFIVWNLLKYGDRQLLTPIGKQYFKPAVLFGIACWFTALWFFIGEGYDMSMGATSAYLINVMMSAVYIVLIAKHPEIRRFSFTVAWTKGLGTALISLFMVMAPLYRYDVPAPAAPSAKGFLLVLCAITLVLDGVYIGMFRLRLRAPDAPIGGPVPAR